jgi:hypothetical protein
VIAGSVLLALAVRAVLLLKHPVVLFAGSDNTWYVAVARSIGTGHGVTLPAVTGGRAWTFRFPPAYPAILALGQHLLFWMRATDADLWTSAALGAAAAGVVAALGWRIADRAVQRQQWLVASVAGVLFAVNPLLAGASVSLMAESLYLLVVATALVLVDRISTGSGSALQVVMLGAVVGIGALTRSEGAVVLGGLVVAGFVVARRRGGPATPWIIALAIGVALPAAWSLFGSSKAHRPVVVATNSGSLLLGANCPSVAHGAAVGFWDLNCLTGTDPRLSAHARAVLAAANHQAAQNPFTIAPVAGAPIDAELNAAQLAQARQRVMNAPGDLLRAVPFRALRVLGLYWSAQQDRQEYFEGRNHNWETAGRWFHLLVVLPLTVVALVAIASAHTRSGRRLRTIMTVDRIAPCVTTLGAVLLIAVASYGSTRFRVAAEPALAVLGALGSALVIGTRAT